LEQTLSEHLLEIAADCSQLPELDAEPSGREASDLIERLTAWLLESREVFPSSDLSSVEALVRSTFPDFLNLQFDDYYTRKLLRRVQGMVKRSLQLERLPHNVDVPAGAATLLQEATRTWVFGFPHASICLCRAALEDSLRRHGDTWCADDLKQSIENCRRTRRLDDANCQMAHYVRRSANAVLHRGQVLGIDEASNVLAAARAVIAALLSNRS
jgi:hypothetical protein